MDFQAGDKVKVTGKVDSTEPGAGWITVNYDGCRVITAVKDVELVERTATPGQRAFEAWAGKARIGGPLGWEHVGPADRALWDSIADAARSGD